jgi:SAM-dependent methyltransferase
MRNGTETKPPQSNSSSDHQLFWRSYYSATVDGEPDDWMTIGPVCEPESRFHYCAVELAIIEALTKRFPIPKMRKVWKFAQSRAAWRVLDTGHWINFFRQVYLANHVTGIEITDQMVAFLRERFPDCDIRCSDISEPLHIEPVDVVSAIGVMFHIVDDRRWHSAIGNLSRVLKPDGVMLIGGDFGAETANVQFHKSDSFSSWQEHESLPGDARIVNKRVRSLADWHRAASDHGLAIVDLVRSHSHPSISTPENDLLVLAPL